MAFLNYLLQFKAFSDKNPSNSPDLTNMNWVRDVQGVSVDNQSGQVLTIAPSATVTVFTGANKKFLYLEASADLTAVINGSASLVVKPVVVGSATKPGSLLLNSTLTSLALTNNGAAAVTVFVASAE